MPVSPSASFPVLLFIYKYSFAQTHTCIRNSSEVQVKKGPLYTNWMPTKRHWNHTASSSLSSHSLFLSLFVEKRIVDLTNTYSAMSNCPAMQFYLLTIAVHCTSTTIYIQLQASHFTWSTWTKSLDDTASHLNVHCSMYKSEMWPWKRKREFRKRRICISW